MIEHYQATTAEVERLAEVAKSRTPMSDMDAHYLSRGVNELIGMKPLIEFLAEGYGLKTEEDSDG